MSRKSFSRLTKEQQQLLLGTMLGDGHVTARSPRYSSNHGWIPRRYNWTKYHLLSEFVTTPPRRQKNGGFGKWLCRFNTRTGQAFTYLLNLCYAVHPTVTYKNGQPKRIKTITNKWLKLIDDAGFWETMAWWIGDDGSLLVDAMVLNTQGFTHADVTLLQNWLASHGIAANIGKVRNRKRNKTYLVLKLTADATRYVCENVLPHIPKCMTYKVTLSPTSRQTACFECGAPIQTKKAYAPAKLARLRRFCSEECRHTGRLHVQHRYAETHREQKNQAAREAYYANLETARARARVHTAAYLEKHRDAHNLRRRVARAKKIAARQPLVIPCERCQQPWTQPHPNSRYCPTCKPIVVHENKTRSALAHPRSSKSNMPVSGT